MKKQWMKMVSMLCMVVLLVGLLTACGGEGDPEERGKKSGNQTVKATETPVVTPTSEATPTDEPTPEATPTEEPTPEATPTEEPTPEATPTEEPTPEATPTEEPTPEATPTEEPTPEVTPTDELTPTPQVTPTDLTFSTKTETYTKSDGKFSVKLPDDAKVTEYEDGIIAETANCCFSVWYVNTLYDGVIYDAIDCSELMKTETDYKELLGVDAMSGVRELEKTSLNGVVCVNAFADRIDMTTESRAYSGGGQYYAYSGKFDSIGVYTVVFTIETGNNYYSDGQKEWALFDLWTECAKSLMQLDRSMEYAYGVNTVELKDGTEIEFAYDEEELDRIERDEDGDTTLYFNAGIAESITIQHFTPENGIKTAEDYYKAKQKKYNDEKFHYSELSEYSGRLKYQHWTLTYREAGDDYTEKVFMHECEDGTMFLIVLLRYTDWADDGELLLDDLLWTMREK